MDVRNVPIEYFGDESNPYRAAIYADYRRMIEEDTERTIKAMARDTWLTFARVIVVCLALGAAIGWSTTWLTCQ